MGLQLFQMKFGIFIEIDNFGNKYIVRLPNEEQKTSDLKKPNIKTKVPENEIFFLGDNRCKSFDSRDFGTVNENQIEGAVLAVVWSYNKTFGFLFKRMFQNLNSEKHSYFFKYKRTS